MSRLVYYIKEKGKVTPEACAPEPGALEDGWILGEFVSGTICATDVTNMEGELGHEINPKEPKIVGHECCFRVIESKNKSVEVGKYIVPLGSDFYGFAEREAFLPILPCTPDEEYMKLTELTPRGYYDPDEQVKAVCITGQWFSGISLIEPTTHVFTALLHTGAFNARSVVILGAGFCGQIAGLLCKMFGVQRVTMIEKDVARTKQAIDRGCADTVEVKGVQMPGLTPSDPDSIKKLINDTKGMYADVVFDALLGYVEGDLPPAGKGPGKLAVTRDYGAQLLRPGGIWVMYSAASYMQMPAVSLLAKGIEIRGAGYDSRLIGFPKRAAQMEFILRLAKQDKGICLGDFIARHIDFAKTNEVEAAFQAYKDKTASDIKIEIRNQKSLTSGSSGPASRAAEPGR